MSETIIAALITGFVTLFTSLLGCYFANRKSAALTQYRLEMLEKKVDLHNSVIERMYNVEKRADLFDEKISEANRRISCLEQEN